MLISSLIGLLGHFPWGTPGFLNNVLERRNLIRSISPGYFPLHLASSAQIYWLDSSIFNVIAVYSSSRLDTISVHEYACNGVAIYLPGAPAGSRFGSCCKMMKGRWTSSLGMVLSLDARFATC